MNWINAFELMCYIIVAIMLLDCVHKKDYNALFTFGAAAIVGIVVVVAHAVDIGVGRGGGF